MSASELASSNFSQRVASNPYPGRGLIIGKSASGEAWQQVYWIMGRSEHSRNRQFSLEGVTLRTEPVDPSKVDDPSLIIYEAMLELGKKFLVSNGDQTRTLYEGLEAGKRMPGSLAIRDREPDAPNYTPRITGMLELDKDAPRVSLSILKANKIDPAYSDRHYFYPQEPANGLSYGLTTYEGDGNPLPSFSGDPLVMPLQATAEETLEAYWNALDADNKISVAVKEIALDGSSSRVVLKNKY